MANHWGGLILMEPSDLERMFSQEDAMSTLPSVWEELQDESLPMLNQVTDLLEMLPPREADFIELYFFKKLRQTAIAELYNVSQPTVCYRLQRGAARLRFLIELPTFRMDDMKEDLQGVFEDPVDVEIMLGMARSTCQSEVARDLGGTQGFVRHRFLRSLRKLREHSDMGIYVEVFEMVEKNLNILKDTCRATWGEEVIHSIS
jgi:hypothetical protein